ncbi:MAG: cytochrome b [Xanthomonadaceae bacterium]|nr:cytochrome b [Xanthomonadaceae bacterium]
MNAVTRPRYTPTLRLLHWLMAVLIVLAYILIEQRGIFPRGSDGRFAMMQGHFWVGIGVFLLVWWRLMARVRGGTPPITPPLGKVSVIAAKLLHLALYAFFIVMPLLGLATVWTDGKELLIPFTSIALPALLPENEDLAHQLEELHGTIGEAFYWVIGAHVLVALWHHVGRRDDTLKRML